MNSINCGVVETPGLVFVLPLPPLVERIALRLLELGFTLQHSAEFVEESIAEMDFAGDMLVWEGATDSAPLNHCDFLCLLDGGECAFSSVRLRLSAELHPEHAPTSVRITTTSHTYRAAHEPPYEEETLRFTVTPLTWPKYETDVLHGRLLAGAQRAL
jgi:hypothetical protein